jgi:hypothetical protein
MEGRPKSYRPTKDKTGCIARRESLKRYIVDLIGQLTINASGFNDLYAPQSLSRREWRRFAPSLR